MAGSPSDTTARPPAGAVFLSYAREDAEVARRIAEALRAFGVEVWFDQNELRGGDQWDAKIRTQIKTCALFVPIISATTENRPEGYFRREWKLAVDRTQDMGSNRAFIVPVVIDDTKEAGADVPEEFMRYQWTRLPQGVPTPQFVEQVKKLLEAPRKIVGPVADRAPDQRSGLQPSRAPWIWPAAVVVLGVIALGLWLFLPNRPPTAAPATPPTAAPAAIPVSAAKVDDKSVAVLAFADLSEARNSEYFSDGVSEELLNVLAKVPGLRVAARTSAFFFKGKNLPIPEIAQKLNVAYVVEGSVQRAGDRVKITAQLIKAADGFHLWSDTFTREAKDVFAVQEEIAGRIAKELSLKLGVTSAMSAVNPQALELYLQARQAWMERTPTGFARAEEALNRAVVLEPNFARAYVLLSLNSSVRDAAAGVISRFGQRQSDVMTRMQALIDRALALEPNLAEAHTAQGNLYWNQWRLDDAARELRQAIALNPSDATAHQILGRVLMSDGRMDEGAAALKRAAELDPLSHRILDNYAIALRFAGRYTEALAFDERAVALQPDALQANMWKALDLSALGRHDEAVALVRRLRTDGTLYSQMGLNVLVRAGLKSEAEQLLPQVPSDSRHWALASLGRYEAALAELDPTAMSVQNAADLLVNRVYDPIRHDPRFGQIIATLGLTEAHARAQAWRAAHPLPVPPSHE